MSADEIIKKKKVDMTILNDCLKYGKSGWITYNAFFPNKHKRHLTKDEYMILKGYKR